MDPSRTSVVALTARAMELWEYLAGTAAGFAPAISVAVSPGSCLCPRGERDAGDHDAGFRGLRARPEASRRVARALGFRELGSQVSIRLTTPVTSCGH